MRKRRTESPTLHACSPQRKRKKKWVSGGDAEPQEEGGGGGVDADPRVEDVQPADPAPPSAPGNTVVGERRRKRPRCCADHEAPGPGMDAVDVRGSVRAEVTRSHDSEDDLCAFNSFQFWRTPLPELDLSLLDGPSTSELFTADSSCKDAMEDMET